jgi:toxin-antitoxin system PIN domain toxin
LRVIIPDVNVLVYAYRADSPVNPVYRGWLASAAVGRDVVGLTDMTVSGFLRITTSRKVFEDPSPVSAAVQFVSRLLEAPRVRWVGEGRSTWLRFARMADEDPGVVGDRVPEAYLAAVALAHGARIATADRGFGRYRNLQFFDPAVA